MPALEGRWEMQPKPVVCLGPEGLRKYLKPLCWRHWTWDAKTGRARVPDQPGMHSGNLSKQTNQHTNNKPTNQPTNNKGNTRHSGTGR